MTNVIWLCTKKWNSNDVKMSFPPFHSPPLSIISFIKFLCWLFSLLPYHGRDRTIVFALVSFLKSAPVASTRSLHSLSSNSLQFPPPSTLFVFDMVLSFAINSSTSKKYLSFCFSIFHALPFHLASTNVSCCVIFCTVWQQDNV